MRGIPDGRQEAPQRMHLRAHAQSLLALVVTAWDASQ